MYKNDVAIDLQSDTSSTFTHVAKEATDLLVLRSIAQKVRLTLHTIEEGSSETFPLCYMLAIGHRHTIRIALYDLQALQSHMPLAFVGFVSGKRKNVDQLTEHELQKADEQMIKELLTMPGLLGYASLELHPGIWYNLVLLRDLTVKTHLQHSQTHQYAAYQLAPRYYAWIRLHSGILPSGLTNTNLVLQRTKYYHFQETQPTVYEHSYASTVSYV